MAQNVIDGKYDIPVTSDDYRNLQYGNGVHTYEGRGYKQLGISGAYQTA